jgi:hypothetical protein
MSPVPRFHRAPWGDWVDLTRLLSVSVCKHEKGWHCVAAIATQNCVHEVWSRPHATERDARACCDAFMASIEDRSVVQASPYR